MRITSTIVSLTAHVVLAGAVLWGTAEGRPAPDVGPPVLVLEPYAPVPTGTPRRPSPVTLPGRLPHPPTIWPVAPDDLLPRVPAPPVPPENGLRGGAPAAAAAPDGSHAFDAALVDDPPVLLAGPQAVYPELLRQAGLEGRVILEAVVDTTGRIELASVTVVSATHGAFVAPARQSLVSSLFRPGRVRGRAVRVRVRVPMDFRLRRGG